MPTLNQNPKQYNDLENNTTGDRIGQSMRQPALCLWADSRHPRVACDVQGIVATMASSAPELLNQT